MELRRPEPASATSAPRRPVIPALLLALVTVVVYWPVRHHDFINLDDKKYVTHNPQVQAGLTWKSAAYAFTTTDTGNWHPVTWLSHMLDCELYGLDPGKHHLTSLLLHAANTMLLLVVLQCMTGALWRSAFVAGLFALHPLHVESVAWASERKDLLSTFFLMLTLWAYAKHVSGVSCRVPGVRRGFQSRFYRLALLFFVVGLMCKPMLVTVPFILLLLDYWPFERVNAQLPVSAVDRQTVWRLLREKAPFFGLSAVSCAVTFWAQSRSGAVVTLTAIPVMGRVVNAAISYARYLWKMIWPSDLAVYYPHPKAWPAWEVVTASLVLIAITAGVIAIRHRARYWCFGWFWYLGTLVPVIGLVQVGGQSMADRYTYIPSIGLFVAVVWGLAHLLAATLSGRVTLATLGVVLIAACAWVTGKQLEHWQDSVKLFRHALAVALPNARAHACLAQALLDRNELEEAKVHFEATLEFAPRDVGTLVNLGTVYGRQGKLEEAIRCFEKAVSYDPNYPAAQCNWGFALSQKGQVAKALVHYREAIRLQPDYAEALNGLAWLLATSRDDKIRDGAEAVRLAKRAVEATSGADAGNLDTLAAAYAQAGQFSNAVATAEMAVRLAESSSKQQADEFRVRLQLYQRGLPHRSQ